MATLETTQQRQDVNPPLWAIDFHISIFQWNIKTYLVMSLASLCIVHQFHLVGGRSSSCTRHQKSGTRRGISIIPSNLAAISISHWNGAEKRRGIWKSYHNNNNNDHSNMIINWDQIESTLNIRDRQQRGSAFRPDELHPASCCARSSWPLTSGNPPSRQAPLHWIEAPLTKSTFLIAGGIDLATLQPSLNGLINQIFNY